MSIDRKDVMNGISILQNMALQGKLSKNEKKLEESARQLNEMKGAIDKTEENRKRQKKLKDIAYESNTTIDQVLSDETLSSLFKYLKLEGFRSELGRANISFSELDEIRDREYADHMLDKLNDAIETQKNDAGSDYEKFVEILNCVAGYSSVIDELDSSLKKARRIQNIHLNKIRSKPISPIRKKGIFGDIYFKSPIRYWVTTAGLFIAGAILFALTENVSNQVIRGLVGVLYIGAVFGFYYGIYAGIKYIRYKKEVGKYNREVVSFERSKRELNRYNEIIDKSQSELEEVMKTLYKEIEDMVDEIEERNPGIMTKIESVIKGGGNKS